MEYAELKKEAAELGIKFVGVKAEKLAEMIKEAKASGLQGTQGEPKSEPKAKKTTHNTAIVYDKGSEVRRYTVDLHGNKFADLAGQFATKNKCRVELVTL